MLCCSAARQSPICLPVRAQKSDQLRCVAVLGDSPSTWNVWIVGFAERLRELGWIEDRTIAIEYHWSEGRPERVASCRRVVRRKPDVIVTYGAPPEIEAGHSFHPHRFCLAIDPLGAGLVQDLSRPGGNVTGCRPTDRIQAASGLRFWAK